MPMFRLLKVFLIVAVLSGLLAGCGGKVEETYILTTIREATRGDLLSPGFKYSFDTPNFVAAYKDMALVREGNLIEFFSGQGIESKLEGIQGRKFVVGARKLFSPRIHFTVDFITAGGDTVDVGEPYGVAFPALLKSTDEENFKDVDLDALEPSTLKLKPIYNTKFKVKKAKIGYEEIDYMGDTIMAFTLNLKNVRFIIDDPSDQMALILKALMNENLYFDGAVTFGDRPATSSRSYRMRTKIGGKVKVDFIRYGGHVALTPI